MSLMPVDSYDQYSDSIYLPNIIKIGVNLSIAQFYIMKILPAKYIIEDALKRNLIDRSWTIADTTSGTFGLGLGLGIVCAEYGLKFRIFSDPVIDESLKRRLELLGGEVVIVTAGGDTSPQQERLRALNAFIEEDRKVFCPRQYDNPLVLEAYKRSAELIFNTFPSPLHIVAPVGSGGSSCGIARALRKSDEDVLLTGVDTFGSILFGMENGPKDLRGLGNSIMPGNLNHQAFNYVHWIDGAVAASYTKKLLSKTGIFAGPSSGAAFCVASWLATGNPDQNVVFIAPDTGYRYQNIFIESDQSSDLLPEAPFETIAPHAAKKPWSVMQWDRRTLVENSKLK